MDTAPTTKNLGSMWGRLYHGIEKSATAAGAPSAETIEAVLKSIPTAVETLPTQFTDGARMIQQYLPTGHLRGSWAGTRTRITRRLNFGSPTEGFITHASNVWVIPTTVPKEEADKELELVGLLFSKGLLQQSSDWTTEAFTYNPALHGDLDWWRSQAAGRTRYRDEWPEFSARLAPTENPIGPDSPQVRPPTAGEVAGSNIAAVGSGVASAGSAVKNLVIWGGILYLGYKFISKD